MPREMAFEQAPAFGEIPVSVRQGPDGMEMIRQDDRRIDNKWMPFHHIVKGRPQKFDIFRFTQDFPPVIGNQGEKICPAIYASPAVLHGSIALVILL
jgi:hypothetical protein